MKKLEGFIADVRAAIDRGLPVTAEDVVAGLEMAQYERRRDQPLRYDIGSERVLELARHRVASVLGRTQK